MSFKPDHFVVWFELPVTDFDKAMSFYNAVFLTSMEKIEMGPNPIAMFPVKDGGRAGHLYPGNPPVQGTGPTVHLACPDALEATMERLMRSGGEVVSDPITIPAGRFTYCLDPDGNSIGLFSA